VTKGSLISVTDYVVIPGPRTEIFSTIDGCALSATRSNPRAVDLGLSLLVLGPPLVQIEHDALSAPTAGTEYAELVPLWISQHNP
jgi:hypothetical protein